MVIFHPLWSLCRCHGQAHVGKLEFRRHSIFLRDGIYHCDVASHCVTESEPALKITLTFENDFHLTPSLNASSGTAIA